MTELGRLTAEAFANLDIGDQVDSVIFGRGTIIEVKQLVVGWNGISAERWETTCAVVQFGGTVLDIANRKMLSLVAKRGG